jgi:flagellar operon protein (TIGR03826 family)
MSWANCSRCGKAYTKVAGGRDYCQDCIKEEEDNYKKIFHFLSTRPSATAQEIAQETEVDIKEIFRYVRENRLMLVKTDTGLFCESCGISISQGKLCDKCRQKLSEEIHEDIGKYKHSKQKNASKKEAQRDPKYLKNYRNEKGKK